MSPLLLKWLGKLTDRMIKANFSLWSWDISSPLMPSGSHTRSPWSTHTSFFLFSHKLFLTSCFLWFKLNTSLSTFILLWCPCFLLHCKLNWRQGKNKHTPLPIPTLIHHLDPAPIISLMNSYKGLPNCKLL